ncbi:MAG TPA: ABC transporter permease [Mycobacteriales bacterium]|nr:ABC transporter permease [Mycobacteriales bacterium]
MSAFMSYTVTGVITGTAYAIAAMGLVVTYTTSKVFNIAHGAIGMVMSFLFWSLAVNPAHKHHLPSGLALALIVLVIAPLLGVAIERIMMRGLAQAPVGVSLVVTVGLLVFCIGGAQSIWDAKTGRNAPGFFPNTSWDVFGANVSGNDLVTVIASLVVAAALYVLLRRSRTGAAMRAVVDNSSLVALHGARPAVLSSLSWAIGSSLAALAGILLSPKVSLDYYQLTLLVISAYAAAMLGKLESLPLTFLGAIVLGLATTYAVGYLPTDGIFVSIRPTIPAFFLFVILLVMRQPQLRVGQIRGIKAVPVPSALRSSAFGVGLVVALWLVSLGLSGDKVLDTSTAMVYALMALSLVPLAGYGGFISLSQFSFVGIGAVIAAKWFNGNALGMVVAAVGTAAVGVLIGAILLRLRGLYLALGTLAFAQVMDHMLFTWKPIAFDGAGASIAVKRYHVGGWTISSNTRLLLMCTVVFVIVALIVLALRRGRFGRLIIALRDSPAACSTLGLSLTWARVGIFAFSASIAGVAGALYGQRTGTVGPEQFGFFKSLPLLLLAIVAGATSATGALLAGFGLMLVDVLPGQSSSAAGLLFLVIGGLAVALARQPNGLAGFLFQGGRRLFPQLAGKQKSGIAGDVIVPAPSDADLAIFDDDFTREEVGLHASS